MARLKLLVLALIVDGTDVGEVWSGTQWLRALGDVADVTLLCLQRPGRMPTADQLPNCRVVSWPEPAFLGRIERVRAIVQPHWPLVAWHAKRWLSAALKRGERFDFAHQLLPQAMRHSCPFRHFDIPFAVGPLGGSLPTPEGFEAEVGGGSPFSRLREIDAVRFRRDPNLRASYQRAQLLLGVAPYVRGLLEDNGVRLNRFETVLERAADTPAFGPGHVQQPGTLRMLHVGRAVRTKGLRDVIRAMAELKDLPGVTLTSAGGGEDLEACRAEVAALGVGDRVTLLGNVSRDRVEELYATHDVFAFPSFREPMGGVFFEAMRWGLPIIAARRGGPEAIVDEHSGVFVDVMTPEALATDLAGVIRALANDPDRVRALSDGSRARLASFGTWDDKAARMVALYQDVIATA